MRTPRLSIRPQRRRLLATTGAATVVVAMALGAPAVGAATHTGPSHQTTYVSATLPVTGASKGARQRTLAAVRPAGLTPAKADLTPAGKPLDTWTTEATLPSAVVHDVTFPSAKVGYAAAELGQVWKTTDGGSTWTRVLNRGFPYYYYGVDAVTKNDIVVSGFNDQTGAGILTWSHDGGQTWQPDQILSANAWVGRVRYVSDYALAMNGLGSSGSAPNAAWYEVGGADWTQVTPDPNGGWFGYEFALLPRQVAYASGITFCGTEDVGATWSCRASIDSVFDGATAWIGKKYGWVGGGEISPDVAGWLHRTTDGGATWSGRVLQTAWPIRQIQMLSQKVGWATGGNIYSAVGGIEATADGGRTWSSDLSTDTEIDACASHPIHGGAQTRVWCIGYDSNFNSTVYDTVVPTP